jgi:FkbM family methyltransferase
MQRLLLFKHFLLDRRNGIKWSELFSRLIRPSAFRRAQAMIDEITDVDEWLKVKLRKPQCVLYWPKEIELRWLYQVIAETLYADDWHYYEWGKTIIEKEDIVADCGAAEGLFGLLASSRCKQVYMIEPLPLFVSALKMTFAEKKNVDILPVALSDRSGRATLTGNGIMAQIVDSQPDGTSVPVTLSTLDDLFFYKDLPVSYIKADLEGYELKMLEGAMKSIAAYSPKIAITTYHKADHAKLISDFITGINPKYQIRVKGIEPMWGGTVMLHAWVE